MNANTQVTLTTALPQAGLKLRTLRMTDGLSHPFEIELELVCEDYDLDYGKLLGSALSVCLSRPDGLKRHFHGLVTQLALAGSSGRFAVYRASVRPWLWLLKSSVDHRIFQGKSVPAIVKTEVFRHRGFDAVDDQLTGTYAKREYCVQYGETDFDFASRLMEEEGIYYYFRHEQDKHVLVLCDSAKAHKPARHSETLEYRPQAAPGVDLLQGMTEWHEQREMVPGAVALADYDFVKPKTRVHGRSLALARQQHAAFEQYGYPAGAAECSGAEAAAKIRREALQGAQRRYSGRGNAFGLAVGSTFRLERHRRSDLNQEYLVTGATHELVSREVEQGSFDATPSFELTSTYLATSSAQPFRPLRLTPKPPMSGPQTARVQGPASSEIHTDKYGRVKVKFFWDREGKDDDSASCWLRVAQASAGKNWGQLVLPRVGEEVIVDFLHGDADQPIVTGRVYNADRMPPYELPAHKTRSTFKTRSSPGGGDADFNELRFEDKKGEEEIYLHAERDFLRVVENNDILKVGFDKKKDGNQTVAIYNNQTLEVGTSGCPDGSQTLKVWKDRKTTLQTGDDTLTLNKGSRTVKLEAGSHTIEAKVAITFKVGQNSITIDQNGITLKGLEVRVEGQRSVKVEGLQVAVRSKTALDLAGLCTQVDTKAVLSMKGALVKIN
jgi:type VI secretion system secreted protein VgrG